MWLLFCMKELKSTQPGGSPQELRTFPGGVAAALLLSAAPGQFLNSTSERVSQTCNKQLRCNILHSYAKNIYYLWDTV